MGPVAPADQPTISAQTVSSETEIDFFTLVTELELAFTLYRFRGKFELVIIGFPSIIFTLTKRSIVAQRRAPIISQ